MEKASLTDMFTSLDPEEVSVDRDSFGYLRVRVNGEVYERVDVHRAFPYTAKDKYIVLESDGNEVGIIEELDSLEPDDRETLEEELEKSYFVPVITRVRDITSRFRKPVWHVETDRGEMTFEVRSRRDTNFITPNRVVIKDADGNKYEIENYRALDKESRDLVEREVT